MFFRRISVPLFSDIVRHLALQNHQTVNYVPKLASFFKRNSLTFDVIFFSVSFFCETQLRTHDDVIKWKHFPRYWPFVRGIHRSPVNSLHKGQWRGALIFSLICAWINGWVNNREAGDLRLQRAHYGVIVMEVFPSWDSVTSLLCQFKTYNNVPVRQGQVRQN